MSDDREKSEAQRADEAAAELSAAGAGAAGRDVSDLRADAPAVGGVAPEVAPVSGMAGPAYAGPVPVRPEPRPKRTSEEIRVDIERGRTELGESVEVLRGKVNELTDWRGQIRKHRREIVIGAAAVGFAVGASMMLRRRR